MVEEEVPAVVAVGPGKTKAAVLPLSSPGQKFSKDLSTPVLKRSAEGFETSILKKHRRNRSAKVKHSNHDDQLVTKNSDTTEMAVSRVRSAGVSDVSGSGRSRQSSSLDQPGPSHHMPRALFKPTGGNKNIKVWMTEPSPN